MLGTGIELSVFQLIQEIKNKKKKPVQVFILVYIVSFRISGYWKITKRVADQDPTFHNINDWIT